MNTLLLIDGNAIMHRAYHALPPFQAKDGTPTNVMYGFFSMLYRGVTDFKPTHLIVCFDTPKPTFRNEVFKEYQAHRPHIADDFKVQIPLLKKAITTAQIQIFERDGFEADDVIGTLAKKAEKARLRVIIMTGDRDILQLVSKNIFVVTPQLGLSQVKLYDEAEAKKKMLVTPPEIPDLKALMGDPSDNYPGAKGIGPKTAAHLIEQFHSVENIYEKLDEVLPEKVKNILEKEKENVVLSKKLATIVTDVPLDIDFDKNVFSGFNQQFKEFIQKYGMNSLVKRIFERSVRPKAPTKKKENEEQIGLF